MILKLTNLWYAVNIDVNGHYAIYGVSAGEYQLEAFAPGYVVQSYNGHTYQGQADTITVGPGDNLTINFSLNPGASSISGTVRSADGVTPVPNAKVTAYTADTGLQAFGGLANANGEYIIDGLPPGDYKVEATSNDRSEWYQDKPHIDQADKVTVSALGNTPGINFTLEPAATTSTATGTGVASFTSDAGTIENLTAVAEGTLTSTGKPNLVFPHGFFSFNITGLAPGQTVVVTITLPSTVPVGTTYWKYHTSEGGWIQIPMGDDDGDSVITITLV